MTDFLNLKMKPCSTSIPNQQAWFQFSIRINMRYGTLQRLPAQMTRQNARRRNKMLIGLNFISRCFKLIL